MSSTNLGCFLQQQAVCIAIQIATLAHWSEMLRRWMSLAGAVSNCWDVSPREPVTSCCPCKNTLFARKILAIYKKKV